MKATMQQTLSTKLPPCSSSATMSATSTPKKSVKHNNNNNGSTVNLQKDTEVSVSSKSEVASGGGIQDTIYLCNFRVSVDGEWLCLKELQDVDTPRAVTVGSAVGVHSQRHQSVFGQRSILNGIPTHAFPDNVRDTAEIERNNLVNICKLVVKEILEQSLRYGRMLDSDHLPLQHFFIVIEHVLGHGLRPKKGLLGPRKELWDLLQSIENYCPQAQDITASVRNLPTVRTHIGRARAWLRIALMQKKLSDYLQTLIEKREEALSDFYEPHALMMSDEIVVIMGILVGLNVIDCNLCVKEEDLDSQQGVIDFSLYLRSSSRSTDLADERCNLLPAQGTDHGSMIAVLDQKNYIEELNRHLNATVGNLQAKVESLTTTNALMKEDLAIARNSVFALQAENQAIRQQRGCSCSSQSGERKETTDELVAKLSEERNKNAELRKDLEIQISLKAESEVAMKLLEKDIHAKQETVTSLRRQLDDIKQINLEMYRKLQECEDELTQKGEMVSRLQSRASQIGNLLQSLEKKCESKLAEQQQGQKQPSPEPQSPRTRTLRNLQKFEALSRKQDAVPPAKRLYLRIDPIPVFKQIKNNKSPSSIHIVNSGNDENKSNSDAETNASVNALNEQRVPSDAGTSIISIIDSSISDYNISSDTQVDAE